MAYARAEAWRDAAICFARLDRPAEELKAYDEAGLVFYTNATSRKAQELAENPIASLVFPWIPLQRQVRVTGSVAPISRAETAAYFATRPYGSQLGAWASHQSSVLPSRAVLEERYAELERRWPAEVPVPDFWRWMQRGQIEPCSSLPHTRQVGTSTSSRAGFSFSSVAMACWSSCEESSRM